MQICRWKPPARCPPRKAVAAVARAFEENDWMFGVFSTENLSGPPPQCHTS